jgi:hypothetical protein
MRRGETKGLETATPAEHMKSLDLNPSLLRDYEQQVEIDR